MKNNWATGQTCIRKEVTSYKIHNNKWNGKFTSFVCKIVLCSGFKSKLNIVRAKFAQESKKQTLPSKN